MKKFCKNGHIKNEETIYVEKVKLTNGEITFREKCNICRRLNRKKIQESFHVNKRRKPSIQELTDAVFGLITWADLARSCGVTDTALRKQAKRLNITQ